MEHSSNKGIILILSILFIVVMMIPITGLIIAPSDIDWLEQPRYELGGMTLNEIFVDNAQYLETEQLLTNENFSDGTTGWDSANSVNSATGGILSNTGDGTGIYFPLMYNIDKIAILGQKYYHKVRVRVTNSICTAIILKSGNNTINVTQTTPTINTWYELSVLGTIATGDTNMFVLQHIYADTTDATNAVMEVDYGYTFNISTMQTNKQFSPLYNETFDTMEDSEIKVQMGLWVTEGLDTLNIWLTYNAVGLDHILSYDEMLDYYQLYLSYL